MRLSFWTRLPLLTTGASLIVFTLTVLWLAQTTATGQTARDRIQIAMQAPSSPQPPANQFTPSETDPFAAQPPASPQNDPFAARPPAPPPALPQADPFAAQPLSVTDPFGSPTTSARPAKPQRETVWRSASPSGSGDSDGAVKYRSGVARQVVEVLDEAIDFQISTDVNGLARTLSETLGVPVWLDENAFAHSELDTAKLSLTISEQHIPVRAALRMLLKPLGLQGVVQEEGLFLITDYAALAKKGIATNRWVVPPQDTTESIGEALDKKTSQNFSETPLNEAIRIISETANIPILIDSKQLEAIGLTADVPVNLSAENITLDAFLKLMLRDLGLTHTISGELLKVTTFEDANAQLLTRMYFLEGTPVVQPEGLDYDSMMKLIQQLIQPDQWEALGGVCIMAPLTSTGRERPTLMVSATLSLHREIEALLKSIRETSVIDPPTVNTSPALARDISRKDFSVINGIIVPDAAHADRKGAAQGGGGMGGGMGGMGGMGGGMGGMF